MTALDPRGVPTPVAATRLYPPASRMTPLTPEERAAAIAASPLRPEVRGAPRPRERRRAARRPHRGGGGAGGGAPPPPPEPRSAPAPRRRRSAPQERPPETMADQVGDILDSGIGRQVTREIVRGVFGMLRRRR